MTFNIKQQPCSLAPSIDSDMAFIGRLDYTDPIAKASIWLHKLLIRMIHWTDERTDWYRNKCAGPCPTEETLSEILDRHYQTLRDRITYYGEMLALYQPGTAPTEIIETDFKCGRILHRHLAQCRPPLETLRNYHAALEDFWNFLNSAHTREMRAKDYLIDLSRLLDALCAAFRAIAAAFKAIEENAKAPLPPPPATPAEVAEIVAKDGAKTRKAVHREANGVKANTVACTHETYEGCHHPKPSVDVIVQAVIDFLSKPGNGDSIKNACRIVAKKHNYKLNSLYDWCREHKALLLKDVELKRAQQLE